jgi:hypothetical protein
VPLINELTLHVAPPEVPPSLPQAEPELTVDAAPPEPTQMSQPSVPQPSARVPARLATGFKRLDLACVNAVRGQRMLPAFEDGKPIESSVAVPVVWNLIEK